jgi:DUF1365 family protein
LAHDTLLKNNIRRLKASALLKVKLRYPISSLKFAAKIRVDGLKKEKKSVFRTGEIWGPYTPQNTSDRPG